MCTIGADFAADFFVDFKCEHTLKDPGDKVNGSGKPLLISKGQLSWPPMLIILLSNSGQVL